MRFRTGKNTGRMFRSGGALLWWCVAALILPANGSAAGIVDAVGGKLKKWFMPPVVDSVKEPRTDTRILFRFFDEAFTPGGFVYVYPEASRLTIDEEQAKHGEVSLRFELAPDDYSGGAVCLYNMTYDLRPYLKKAALQFWIKGEQGDEKVQAALVDEAKSDGRKTVVRVPVDWFGEIRREWSLISIPLEDMVKINPEGVYWNRIQKKEHPETFDWDRVAEFRIEVRKNENKSLRIWLDDIVIVDITR
jgi:hypothetical protein